MNDGIESNGLKELMINENDDEKLANSKNTQEVTINSSNFEKQENLKSNLNSGEKRVSFANTDKVKSVTQDDFWVEHKLWKDTTLNETLFLNPTVSDPQSSTRTLRNPNPSVYYKVFIEDIEGFVTRRYSDFEWLQDILQNRYVGMVIPPLPPKVLGSGQRMILF